MGRRFSLRFLTVSAAVMVLLCPFGTAAGEGLPAVHPSFTILPGGKPSVPSGSQGLAMGSKGVAVVPLSSIENSSFAEAVFATGERVLFEAVESVDEMCGLARVRLGRGAPYPARKIRGGEPPAPGQRIISVAATAQGVEARTECGVEWVRELPGLPGFFGLRTSLALPPPGGALYSSAEELAAVVILRSDILREGIAVSAEVVERVMNLKPSREPLETWSGARSGPWSQSPPARYMEAIVQSWSGRPDRAVELLEPLVGKSGVLEGPVAALLGESFLAMDRVPESIVALKSAIDEGLATCRIFRHLAWAYLETGQLQEAWEYSEKVVETRPDEPAGYLLLARIENLRGDHERAVFEARRALKHKPDCQCAYIERGTGYLGQGRFEPAIDSFSTAVELNPEDAAAHHMLGYAYLRSGRPRKAVDSLFQAISLNPENAGLWKDLGEALSRSGRGSGALEAYRQAVRIQPKDQNAWYRLASECLRQGLENEAVSILEEGMERCGTTAWLTYHLGKACFRAGQTKRAFEEMERLSVMNAELGRQLHRYMEVAGGG